MVQKSADRSFVEMRDTKESFSRRIDRDRRECGIENHDSVTQTVDDFPPQPCGQRRRLTHGDGDQIAPYHKTSNGLIIGSMGNKNGFVT